MSKIVYVDINTVLSVSKLNTLQCVSYCCCIFSAQEKLVAKTPTFRRPFTIQSGNQHGGEFNMAATSGHVSVVIADCYRFQYWHGRSDSEAWKNRFIFWIFARIAFHSGPSDGRQQAGV